MGDVMVATHTRTPPSWTQAKRIRPLNKTRQGAPRKARPGFTLIELLAVMAIMGLMMGLAVMAFKDMGRGRGMRGATLQFKTHLGLARQNAITKRMPVRLAFGNVIDNRGEHGFFVLESTTGVQLGQTNLLPAGVIITNEPANLNRPWRITFKPDGSIDKSPDASDGIWSFGVNKQIKLLTRGARSITNEFSCYLQTGRIRVRMGATE